MNECKHEWVYNYTDAEICCSNSGQGSDIDDVKELEQKVEGLEEERDCDTGEYQGVSETTCGDCQQNNYKLKEGAET